MNIPFFILHVLFLVWVAFIFLSGILVFGTGFLLTRIEIQNQSSCNSSEEEKVHSPCSLGAHRRFNRAVVLIIDGLRHDFAEHDPKLAVSIYHNKMPIFKQLRERFRDRAFLAPFVADPPTTTLQRLKGLTTGSLPTFIDAGANFFSDEITEDNIISQAVRYGKRIVFMGDDTWTALFPRHFHRSFPYPSFNVKDLHTVDNGIMRHLPDEMKKKDWDILIAHFLGVDHCGHRYGPNHHEMAAKLKQMNHVISDVVKALDDEMVLFVMGDHGMTETGDHGGDSTAEVLSTLFMYSKSRLIVTPQFEQEDIFQVDFVPTFSMLLGLPIPFSNLGSAIPVMFEECDKALLDNANQVSYFLQEYAAVSSQFSTIMLRKMEETLGHVKNLHLSLPSNSKSQRQICKGYRDYLKRTKEMCSAMWAHFDAPVMFLGITLLSSVVILLGLLLFTSKESNLKMLTKCIGIGTAIGVLLCSVLWFFQNLYQDSSYQIHLTRIQLLGICCFISVFFPIVQLLKSSIRCRCLSMLHEDSTVEAYTTNANGNFSLKDWIISKSSLKDFSICFPSLVTGIYFTSFFSNSLVVNEDSVTELLCQSLVIINVAPSCIATIPTKGFKLKLGRLVVSTVVLMICIRFGFLFFTCREEQEHCLVFLDPKMKQTWHLILAAIFLFLPVLAFILWLKRFSTSYDLSQLFVSYALPSGALCIVAQWTISRAPERMLKKLLPGNQEIAGKTSLWLCLTIIIVILLRPVSSPLTSVLDKFAYSLCLNLMSIVSAVVLTLYLVAGDRFAIGLGVVVLYAMLCAYLASRQNVSKDREIPLGWRCTVFWAMVSSYGFFVTGHQAVFSTINWNAAFVVSNGNSTGKLEPALAITLETFSSQILFALGLPLLPAVYIILASQQMLSLHQISDISTYRPFLPIWGSSRGSHLEESLLRLQLSFLLFSGIKLMGTVLACTVLRRHLMVWKIFAPRFVFESASCLVILVMTLFAHLVTLRISSSLSSYARKKS